MSYERALRNPTFVNKTTGQVMPNDTRWQDQHRAALKMPRGFERPIIEMLASWAMYADTHRAKFGSGVGNDGYAGDEWRTIGKGIHALLNCDTGRLDCGTLSAFIYDTLAAEGFTE